MAHGTWKWGPYLHRTSWAALRLTAQIGRDAVLSVLWAVPADQVPAPPDGAWNVEVGGPTYPAPHRTVPAAGFRPGADGDVEVWGSLPCTAPFRSPLRGSRPGPASARRGDGRTPEGGLWNRPRTARSPGVGSASGCRMRGRAERWPEGFATHRPTDRSGRGRGAARPVSGPVFSTLPCCGNGTGARFPSRHSPRGQAPGAPGQGGREPAGSVGRPGRCEPWPPPWSAGCGSGGLGPPRARGAVRHGVREADLPDPSVPRCGPA